MNQSELLNKYRQVRERSIAICEPLEIEDYVLQPIVDVSPPKWHLGHTTWFFETFILIPYYFSYQIFNPNYNYVFNSYYETIGARVIRTDRGNLSRPSVAEVKVYRHYIDKAMNDFLSEYTLDDQMKEIFILGLNHEQQHQELLITDIKYILGHNPLFPPYLKDAHTFGEESLFEEETILKETGRANEGTTDNEEREHDIFLKNVSIKAGLYEIGYDGDDFCFDNELSKHRVYVEDFTLSGSLVTNGEYLEFMNDGGYSDFEYWHADGWDWVKTNGITSPLYWHKIKNNWQNYTLNGLNAIKKNEPVCHISYYEASAFSAWKGTRLPTEAEWEIAADHLSWGQRWEWTESAYLPYPGFKKAPGAIGEYNGKFMVNQMVLRGASIATSPNHSRKTYRNFFPAPLRWQFTGIRLIKP